MSDPTTISAPMTHDHRRCDELFAAAEEAVNDEEWGRAKSAFEAFHQAMLHHFGMEEGELFPAFEARTGSPMGPTAVMRMEHEQMRALFAQMGAALESRDRDACLGASETLLVMMQQHNVKEEQILYPMTDQVLGDQVGELLERMRIPA